MSFRPGLLRGGKAPAVAEQEFREAVSRAQQIGSNVLATAEEITGGFFLVGRDVNRGEGAGSEKDGELAGSRRSVLTRSPGRRGISAGAMTSPARRAQ